MTKVTICTGIQGSGKSTAALAKVMAEPGRWFRVNRDSIRLMLGEPFSKDFEKTVRATRNALIQTGILLGLNIIVDDMNLDVERTKREVQALAGSTPVEFEIIDMTSTPLEVCIERDSKREKPIGEQVIRKAWRHAIAPTVPLRPYVEGLPWVIISDLDGTLANMGDRSPYAKTGHYNDTPNKAVMSVLSRFWYDSDLDAEIFLFSGRSEETREETLRWLDLYCIEYTSLHMRPEGDQRKDAVIKREIFDREVEGKYNVLFVFDDRDQCVDLWRELGLTCFQVNYGSF